ncbi:hypothetical protein QUB53_19730 [Microcoleus sp. AT8-B4]|uniref:hypothetical protein n=1 Tax=unclassified Microcoleus TaxID=2642155 RepID=UPI002FD4FAAC
MTKDKKVMNELKNLIYTQLSNKYNKCLWPKSDCTKDCINAHSIQNSQILDKLASNNHVVMAVARLNLDTGSEEIEFKKVGRNKATTFTGLCKKHDSELFRPIDMNEFDVSNQQQKFLFAYRSVLRELHTRIKKAIDSQNIYQEFVNKKQCDPKNMDKPMLDATMAIANAYDLYKYKQIYDNIYNSNSFTKIEHECIRIERNCPLAVSSLFDPIKSIIWLKIPEPKFIVLNVFPQKKDTIILLSYLGDHQKDLRPYADEIINASGEYQIYLLSKTILRYCENFVISPDHFNLFSQQKIDAIKNFYLATVTQIDIDHNDENLMLF